MGKRLVRRRRRRRRNRRVGCSLIVLIIIVSALIVFAVSQLRNTSTTPDAITVYNSSGESLSVAVERLDGGFLLRTADLEYGTEIDISSLQFSQERVTVFAVDADGSRTAVGTHDTSEPLNISDGNGDLLLRYVPVQSVVCPGDLVVGVGLPFEPALIIYPPYASNPRIQFESANEDILAPNADGILIGQRSGNLNVLVRLEGGPNDMTIGGVGGDSSWHNMLIVSVQQLAEDIHFRAHTLRLYEGQTVNIAFEVYTQVPPGHFGVDIFGGQNVTWHVSDDEMASVDANGNLTGYLPGRLIVTARTTAAPYIERELEVEIFARNWTCDHSGPTFIHGIMIVNHDFSLPTTYAPGVSSQAQAAVAAMRNSASRQGVNFWVTSDFRSYDNQRRIWDARVAREGEYAASNIVARPGHSEHQSGLAFDFTVDGSLPFTFGDTRAGIWLAENAHYYGFILRYPRYENAPANEPRYRHPITQIIFEPWHYRYVGVEEAMSIFESGVTLEEYLGLWP